MQKAAEYRRLAAEAREFARHAKSIEIEESFVMIAETWDHLAMKAEMRESKGETGERLELHGR